MYDALQLQASEENILKADPAFEYALAIFIKNEAYSTKAKNFIKDVINEIISGDEFALEAGKITVNLANAGLLNGEYDQNYFNKLDSYFEANLVDPALQAIFLNYFSIQCAVIKSEHPYWPDYRIYWEASKEMLHLALDIGGLVPVAGEICDIANGVIYTIEGDGLNAGLSFASAVPVAGWFATGAKFAYKGTLKFVVKADGVIDFGARNSKRLRDALGLVKGDGKHAHHLIPWKLGSNEVIQKAAKSKSAFHIDEALNGIPLSSADHLTGHIKYTNVVETRLNQIDYQNLSSEETFYELVDLIEHIKSIIKNNPGKNLGDIADLI
jgi:hypothetical protein